MTFEEFKAIVKDGIAKGEVKLSKDLNELDYAIQYAIGREMEAIGRTDLNLTAEQIAELVKKHCGEDVYNRAMMEASAPPASTPPQ